MTTTSFGREFKDTMDAGVQSVLTVTPNDDDLIEPGRAIAAICTVSGEMAVQFPDGSEFVVPVTAGYNQFPFSIHKLLATGTTATATYTILY